MSTLSILALLALAPVLQPADVKDKPTEKPKPGAAATTPPARNESTAEISLATDPLVKKRLEQARDYLKEQAWQDAIRLLQDLIDGRADIFVPVQGRDPKNLGRLWWVSTRAEAERLLASMPAEGLAVYERQYGAQAAKDLAKLMKRGGPQGLASLVRHHFHTKAGAEAADLLGTYYLDRGQPLMAALCYTRLLNDKRADQLSSLALFKATLAFRQADPSNDDLALETWNRLANKVGHKGLQVGKETVSLERLHQKLENASTGKAKEHQEWPLFRGDARRSGISQGSAPLLLSKWQRSNIDERVWPGEEPKVAVETKRQIEEALQFQQNRPESMISAFLPIATGGKVIFRSYWGIHGVDIKTGELAWESQATASLNALLGDTDKKYDLSNWLEAYKNGNNQNLIFENSVVGTLSTDNIRVYAVDDMGLPPHPSAVMGNPWRGWGGGDPNIGSRDIVQRSRLVAIDLEAGKLRWEHGDRQHMTERELAGSYFLGPPLPVAGKLYMLTEKNAELRLVCLEPADGKLVWIQTLAKVGTKLLEDPSRRIQAVHLAYADGILVCPTNAGAILGIDLLSRSIIWAFQYREKSKENLTEQEKKLRTQRMWSGVDPQNLPKLAGEWRFSAPIIEEGKVVFTAPDSDAIYCLNLRDGKPLWQAERKDGLYLAGVFDGMVVLVGKISCRALSLADGQKQLWQLETGLPSGMGIASGPFYYLPLRKGEVCKIDLRHGRIAARSLAPRNAKDAIEVPGNLIFYDGEVFSQTETAITCFPQWHR